MWSFDVVDFGYNVPELVDESLGVNFFSFLGLQSDADGSGLDYGAEDR